MDTTFIWFFAVGFCAQLIDGALGMAYGVSANSFLLAVGVSPAAASASVHTAEVFTTAVSGLSHFRLGNVENSLFKRLVIPGVIGGISGAFLLTNLSGERIKPFISCYLLIMGSRILLIALRNRTSQEEKPMRWPGMLGFFGGLCDAIGGGGWGPIVSSTLIARGKSPARAIGSVNMAEFFVTLAQSLTFFITLGSMKWNIILGLMLGGMVAAPLGARLCKRMPARLLMVFVGVLIIVLSLRTILASLGISFLF